MESKGRERYYLPQIATREERQAEEKAEGEVGQAAIVFIALIGAIFFLLGALTCYLIYGLRH